MVVKGNWRPGAKPLEIFEAAPFQSKKKALFDIKRAMQKGSRSFAENGRGPDPEDPLVAHRQH